MHSAMMETIHMPWRWRAGSVQEDCGVSSAAVSKVDRMSLAGGLVKPGSKWKVTPCKTLHVQRIRFRHHISHRGQVGNGGSPHSSRWI